MISEEELTIPSANQFEGLSRFRCSSTLTEMKQQVLCLHLHYIIIYSNKKSDAAYVAAQPQDRKQHKALLAREGEEEGAEIICWSMP